jgi:hypothetical protein
VKVSFHPHAGERLAERGATEAEVVATVIGGEVSGKVRPNWFSEELHFSEAMAWPILYDQTNHRVCGSRGRQLACDYCDCQILLAR